MDSYIAHEPPAKRLRLESDEPKHGNPSDQSLVIDINQLENAIQIELVEAVLRSSQDIGGAEVDEEQTTVLLEERLGAETSFQENTTELLAYMGISTSTTVSSWGDILLDLCETGDYMLPLKNFIGDCKTQMLYREESAEPIDDYLNRYGRESWSTHDVRIDHEWDAYASEIHGLAEGAITVGSLSKPSGPLKAVLTCNWHYPTWSSKSPLWGHVMDPTNPSLRAQKEKFGLSPLVRSQNRLPIREHYQAGGIDWESNYPNWKRIEEKSLLNRSLNRYSKLVMVIGTENAHSLDTIINLDSTVEVVDVRLKIPLVRVFQAVPYFKAIRSKATKEVQQVVFFSYHTQAFHHRDVEMSTRAYHDLLWNAISDFAMTAAPTRGAVYFLRQSDINRRVAGSKYENTLFHLAARLRGNEKKSGVTLPEGVVRRAFAKTIRKHPAIMLVPDDTNSYVRCLLMHFISRAQERINDPEWRKGPEYQKMYDSHIRVLDAHRSSGHAKGRATRQTVAYKASDKGLYSTASLKRSATLPRNQQQNRVAALLKVKQIKALRDSNPDDLNPKERAMQDRIRCLNVMDNQKLRDFFRNQVVWWTPWQPNGLRYGGDGCQQPDDFPYMLQDHPAVKVSGVFKPQEKKAFVVDPAAPP